ncbi:hypothetical protein [Thalassotalea sp. G2M2-11]|uniref:substrate-binding periplasmic protein n=1 Tax=Thalassotalea sp. G2M2-11 TaxID=2787627 RepID=UPI0019D144CA|nr:hypothetical protein [Thalassotalea sp. G2M2-11]
MRKKFISIIAILLYSHTHHLAAQTITLYGTLEQSYQSELLEHVLSYHPEKQYTLVNLKKKIPKYRAFIFMNQQQYIDVIFGGSTIEREQQALPIRIPVLKGLNGLRMPLVNKKQANLFKNIHTIEQFKQLVPGQFHRWSDTKVLEANDIRVEKGSDYQGLFFMLAKQRFDYFPRSILEIDWEYQDHKSLNIAINGTTLIYYPTAYYFYVAKDNQTLADDIRYGLEQALSDGSFDQLFYKHFRHALDRLEQNQFKIFILKNPYLSDKTPLKRKSLWIDIRRSHNTIIE